MSILHVTQIVGKLKQLFENKIDMSDVRDQGSDRDTRLVSRCLAAYAVYHHTACTSDEAANSVVDMGDDNGIDAIFYSSTSKELIIVQSKYIKSGTGEPDSGEILKFCTGIEDLINLNFERFNKQIKKRQQQIIDAMQAFDTKYVIILIYTGDRGLADHGHRRIEDLLNKLNDAGEADTDVLVKFKKYDQAKIYNSLSKGLLQDPLDIEIGLHQWGKHSDPFNAYFGYVSGEELAELWKENGRNLFHKNIRNVLGKTEVNDELNQTIQKKPENFWYFNNGVTIIADQIDKSLIGGTNRELGSFKLTNASVVNGAQTISTIGETASTHPDQIKKIFVLVRCIALDQAPPEFGNEVTKANNRQNRIENRDFVSQDPEQIRLREELAHDGVNYSIMRSDQFAKSKISFDIEEATTSLACASGQAALAVQVKREVGKFYENLSKGIYKQIFNASVSGRYIYNCVEINRRIESLIEKRVLGLGRKAGKEYLILIHGNRMIAMLIFTNLKVSHNDIMNIDDSIISNLFNSLIEKLKQLITENFSENFPAVLFKNKTKCEQLEQLCRKA